MLSVEIRFERALATSFGRGRIWLAGDAAHLTFPFSVRSMNEGIIEAQQLAMRSCDVLDDAAPAASLELYGNGRLAYWRTLLASVKHPAAAAEIGDPWLGENASTIVEALPVSAKEPGQLLGRIAR